MVKLTRNNDDNGERVQVLEKIVGYTVELHGGTHLLQVGVHLSVGEPENGDPEEDGAGTESTPDLINPSIIKVVPRWLAVAEVRRLHLVPALASLPVPPGLHGVCGHAVSESSEKQLESGSHDITSRGMHNVEFLADPKNGDTDDEHDGGNGVSQPETDVALGIDHTKLATKSTEIDKHVEIVVNSSDGGSRVDDHALSRWESLDLHVVLRNLLDNEGRNVGLEGSSS